MIYFLRAGDSGPIKIGWSKNKRNGRIETIQAAHYEHIELLLCVEGERRHESALHASFRGSKIRGDWYKPTARLLALIESLRVPDSSTLCPSCRKAFSPMEAAR